MVLFPSILSAQYSIEWERFVDTTRAGFASKVIETPWNQYYVSVTITSNFLYIARYGFNGTWMRDAKFGFTQFEKFYPNFSKAKDTFYTAEHSINSFLIHLRSMSDIRYFNFVKKNNDNKKYLFNAYMDEVNGFSNYIFIDTFAIPSTYTSIASRNRNYLYLDVVTPFQTSNGDILQNYSIEEKDILFKSINKVVLSPDTLSGEPTVGYGVPRALKYFADSSMVVVIASEEVSTSKPIGISFRIVDKSMQEIGAFRILNDSQYTNYNVSIVDAAVLNDNIYVVGYEYLPNSTLKRGFIATVTKQGQFLGYKYLTPEGIYSKIQAVKIHGNTVVCVGAMSDSPDNSTIVPYLVSYDSGLDEATKKEYKWTDTGINSLYDYVATFDNNAIVVGSKGGKPYMAKLLRDPKTSVVESNDNAKASINITPNPSRAEVTIKMRNNVVNEGSISLYSVDGAFITTIYEGIFEREFHKSFSTTSFPIGSYVVVIKGNQIFESLPFTIMR